MAMLRQLPQLQSLDLQLTNIQLLFDEDSDGASWIGNGVWDWVRTPPLAGLPLRSFTVQGAVGLPPDWRQLASLQVLRVVSSPEFGQPWYEEDETTSHQWGSELASGLASLTRLEVKGVVPGTGCDSVWSTLATHALPVVVHGSRGCWFQRPVLRFQQPVVLALLPRLACQALSTSNTPPSLQPSRWWRPCRRCALCGTSRDASPSGEPLWQQHGPMWKSLRARPWRLH